VWLRCAKQQQQQQQQQQKVGVGTAVPTSMHFYYRRQAGRSQAAAGSRYQLAGSRKHAASGRGKQQQQQEVGCGTKEAGCNKTEAAAGSRSSRLAGSQWKGSERPFLQQPYETLGKAQKGPSEAHISALGCVLRPKSYQ